MRPLSNVGFWSFIVSAIQVMLVGCGYVEMNLQSNSKTNANIQVPFLTLTSAAITNSRNVTLNLATGVTPSDRDNCSTFKALALTEETLIAPLLPTAYTITCDTDGNQTLPFSLATAGDGYKTLRLWAIDEEGKISTTFQSVTILLDTTSPSPAITPLVAIPGGTNNNVQFTVTDTPSGNLDTVKLYYAEDGVTFVEIADLTTSPYPWATPAVDVATAVLRITATDKAGNTGSVTTAAFQIISTGPTTPVLTLLSGTPSNSLNVSIGITCDPAFDKIYISESATTSPSWQSCASPIAHTLTNTADGTKTLYVWAKDLAGNISSPGTVAMVLDRTAPTLSLDAFPGPYLSGSTQSISWTATDAHFAAQPVTLSYTLDGTTWTTLGTTHVAAGSYAWTLPAMTDTDIARIRVTATDTLAHATTVTSGVFTIDNTPPTLATAALSINGGAATSSTNFIQASFTLTDNFAASAFCIKYDDTSAPAASDPCWQSVTSTLAGNLSEGPSVAVSNFIFQVGYMPDVYDIYVWAKDHVGLMSTLSNAGAGTVAQDKGTITYAPEDPPVISSLIVSNVVNPSAPPSLAELQIPSGQTVYIRWAANNAPTPLPANPISLYYKLTTDSDWLPIVTAQNIANGSNGGCSVDDPATAITETGCFSWSNSSPTNDPYQIQLRVRNSDNQTSLAVSGILNGGNKIRTLAGNTDPGIDGSAKAAIYFPTGSGLLTFINQFAVAPNGNTYIFDSRGLFRIKPQDRTNTLWIKNTGTLSGLGGPASSVTLDRIYAINVDYDGNLLVRTEKAILRIPTTSDNPNVSLVAGNGTQTVSDVAATDYQFTISADVTYTSGNYYNYPTLISLPNGDIYFNDGLTSFRYYEASSGFIREVPISGTGNYNDGAANLSTLSKFNLGMTFNKFDSVLSHVFFVTGNSPYSSFASVDPSTFVALADTTYPTLDADGTTNHIFKTYGQSIAFKTGLDGNLYYVNRPDGVIAKMDLGTKTFTPIIGTGSQGSCPDNTLATSCAVIPQDLFVTSTGTIYFLDSGRIRTVLRDGRVYTLYGAAPADGDNGSAVSARLIGANFLQTQSTGEIQVLQNESHVIREINTTGNIVRIAGNGQKGDIDTVVDAVDSALYGTMDFSHPTSFITDPANGNIFMGDYNGIYLLDRSVGKWARIVGGTTSVNKIYMSASDGGAGAALDMSLHTSRLIGMVGGKLYYGYRYRVNPGTDSDDVHGIKTYDSALGYEQASYLGASTGANCAPGATALTCRLTQNLASQGQAFFDNTGSLLFLPSANRFVNSATGTYENMGLLQAATSGTYRPGAPDDFIYYCNGTQIIEKNATTMSENPLLWPVSGMTCTGKNMLYDSGDNKLIFFYNQNGITAVGEYYLD